MKNMADGIHNECKEKWLCAWCSVVCHANHNTYATFDKITWDNSKVKGHLKPWSGRIFNCFCNVCNDDAFGDTIELKILPSFDMDSPQDMTTVATDDPTRPNSSERAQVISLPGHPLLHVPFLIQSFYLRLQGKRLQQHLYQHFLQQQQLELYYRYTSYYRFSKYYRYNTSYYR